MTFGKSVFTLLNELFAHFVVRITNESEPHVSLIIILGSHQHKFHSIVLNNENFTCSSFNLLNRILILLRNF